MSANRKTIVVKFGTSTLTHGSPKLNAPHMVDIVRQIAQLHQAGFRVVIVTSGAIAAGRHYLNHPSTSPNHCFQAASSRSRAESADSSLGKIICDL